jgi:hypothetical protein
MLVWAFGVAMDEYSYQKYKVSVLHFVFFYIGYALGFVYDLIKLTVMHYIRLTTIKVPGVATMFNKFDNCDTTNGWAELFIHYMEMKAGKWLWGKISKIFTKNHSFSKIQPSCILKDNYKETTLPVMKGEYNGQALVKTNLPVFESLEAFMKTKCCDMEKKVGAIQILPEVHGAQQPIVYHVCKATNYCAAKRQISAVPQPDPDMLESFRVWFTRIFAVEIQPLLDSFEYSVEDWLNHLSYKKQQKVLALHDVCKQLDGQQCNLHQFKKYLDLHDINFEDKYEMFVKSEKQLYTNGKAPKNRCICSPAALTKYVMGPVTWELEHVFAKNFPGYCGGKNNTEMEEMVNTWYYEGFYTSIQLDGSGYDRTQHQVIKDIVDRQIYNYIAKKITHVPHCVFEHFTNLTQRQVSVTHHETDPIRSVHKIEKDYYFKQIGAVFSGSTDTTLMNTLRMALYNRFTMERYANCKLGVDYDLICKGDDTAVVIRPHVNLDYVLKSYNLVFVDGEKVAAEKFNEVKHGLGQIAKYIKIGNLCDLDFCSTEVMFLAREGRFKIVRQLKRFLTTTVWSIKGKNMDNISYMAYLESLYQSNLQWISNVPIYRALNLLLHRNVDMDLVKKRFAKCKQLFEGSDVFREIFEYFEQDYKYKWYANVKQSQPVNEHDAYDYFFYKYGWTRDDVDQIEDNIIMGAVEGKIYDKRLEELLTNNTCPNAYSNYELIF